MSHLDKARLVLLAATRAFRLTALVVVVVVLSISTHAGAVPLVWSLSDVTFDDTGTATGTFEFNAPSLFSPGGFISVTGGNVVIDPFTYGGGGGPLLLLACGADPNGGRCVAFNLLTPMTDAGGTVTIKTSSSSSFELAGMPSQLQFREVVSGCLTTTGSCVTAVSEPSTLLLLGSGLAGVAAAVRMRFRRRV
jgi:hypothetical protein